MSRSDARLYLIEGFFKFPIASLGDYSVKCRGDRHTGLEQRRHLIGKNDFFLGGDIAKTVDNMAGQACSSF